MLGGALAALIRFSGLAWAVRSTIARDRVSIVLYHDPAPEVFEPQLRWMLRRYSLIPLERLVNAVRSGDWSAVPPRSLVITFDDGRAGNARLIDLFRHHRVEPTVYLCTGLLGARGGPGFEVLGPVELDRMKDSFSFQSHTRSHPVLPACSEDEAWQEIAESRNEVEVMSGSSCDHFAYPAGAYTDREVELVERAGYLSARTIDIGWNHRGSDPFRLKILSLDSPTTTALAADLTGLRWLSRLLEGKAELTGRRREASGRLGALRGRSPGAARAHYYQDRAGRGLDDR